MITYLIVHLCCSIWGIDTNFEDYSRVIFCGMSCMETLLELATIVFLTIQLFISKKDK